MEITLQDKQRAKEVFDSLCRMLDAKEYKYTKNEEDTLIKCTFRGDDLPMDFMIRINPIRQIISLYSPMPFSMSKEKLVEGAIATSIINNKLVEGSFDYSITDGAILFRLTSSYRDSIISEHVFDYMLSVALYTVDEYNDKFLMLSKGAVDIKSFMETHA